MPRVARELEEKGYMHIISRGNGKQILFESNVDYLKYLKLLRKYSEELGIRVCAYCLMSNHIHLLVYHDRGDVSTFMQKISISYSSYYNKKYERTGHLFQGRFKSEIVTDESYFLTVSRYILNNPSKAGICSVAYYRWSSYNMNDKQNEFVDYGLILKLLGGVERYKEFMSKDNDDICMEYDSLQNSDERAFKTMVKLLGVKSGNEIRLYDKKKRDEAIRLLKQHGLTQKQISRFTGLGRGVVQRA